MQYKIIQGSWECANAAQFDTIIYDPPYNEGWYGSIPIKAGKNNSLVVFSDPFRVNEAIRGGEAAGYNFVALITWDCVSSWYTPGRILSRSNLIAVFSDNRYDADAAIIEDGRYRRSRRSSNERGVYVSVARRGAHLSTVFQKMRSTMKKTHPHEKPVELVSAILAGFGCADVLDCFTGSGACSIAAIMAGAEVVEGYDVSEESVETARRNIGIYTGEIAPEFHGGLFP